MKRWIALTLGLALLPAPTATSQSLDLTVTPPILGPGDSGVATVLGNPGDLAFLLTSHSPGPITLPIVGSMDVGLMGLDFVVFGALPASGLAQFPCTVPCTLMNDIYMQAVTIGGSPFVLTGKSSQFVLRFDDTLIDDCDGNGIDDDCDTSIIDCNDNGTPDACDISSGTSMDMDGDGVPDECCPELCTLQARYTFDGPLPPLPYLLTIQVIVPGVPAGAGNGISFLITSAGLPTSVTSSNGQVVATNFQFVGNGLSFDITYTPAAGADDFGAAIWMTAEAEGHCEKATLSGGMRSRCELLAGTSFASTHEPGNITILSTSDTCP